jgi:hypothetical protein
MLRRNAIRARRRRRVGRHRQVSRASRYPRVSRRRRTAWFRRTRRVPATAATLRPAGPPTRGTGPVSPGPGPHPPAAPVALGRPRPEPVHVLRTTDTRPGRRQELPEGRRRPRRARPAYRWCRHRPPRRRAPQYHHAVRATSLRQPHAHPGCRRGTSRATPASRRRTGLSDRTVRCALPPARVSPEPRGVADKAAGPRAVGGRAADPGQDRRAGRRPSRAP